MAIDCFMVEYGFPPNNEESQLQCTLVSELYNPLSTIFYVLVFLLVPEIDAHYN